MHFDIHFASNNPSQISQCNKASSAMISPSILAQGAEKLSSTMSILNLSFNLHIIMGRACHRRSSIFKTPTVNSYDLHSYIFLSFYFCAAPPRASRVHTNTITKKTNTKAKSTVLKRIKERKLLLCLPPRRGLGF